MLRYSIILIGLIYILPSEGSKLPVGGGGEAAIVKPGANFLLVARNKHTFMSLPQLVS